MDETSESFMKDDWNARAKEDARHYIATTQGQSEEIFAASGKRDVEGLFLELEHLLSPTVDVLDIGCGIGRMDAWVAPQVNSLTGIDVSGEMVARATKRLEHLPNVRFVEGDGLTLGVLDGASFDLVFSHIVFQHMPRAAFESYMKDVLRVLRPGGNFVFQQPGANDHTPADPPLDDSFEMRFYREEELRTQLESAGYQWHSCKRFPIDIEGSTIAFEQLRIHASKPQG